MHEGQCSDRDAVVRSAIERANELRRAKDFPGAVEILSTQIARHPDDARLIFTLGNVLLDQGNLPSAEKAYQRAVELDAEDARAWNNLAVVYKRQGRVSDFVRTYKKAQRVEMMGPRSRPRRQTIAPRVRLVRLLALAGAAIALLWGLIIWARR